jgi:hypothetical protein
MKESEQPSVTLNRTEPTSETLNDEFSDVTEPLPSVTLNPNDLNERMNLNRMSFDRIYMMKIHLC